MMPPDAAVVLSAGALPILGIVALVLWIGSANSRRQEKTALDILKERYARGEIDQAEFEQKRRDLEGW